jgi:hypothetical protein
MTTAPPNFAATRTRARDDSRLSPRPFPRSQALRHSAVLLLCAAAAILLPGCYERKQTAVINPDGSGKIFLETLVTIPSQAPPGREKPTPLAFGRQLAGELINTTRGVEAWADLAITEADATHARIAATAYFKDLNALRFDQTLLFVWKRDADGRGGATFSVERVRTSVRASRDISDAELAKLVAQAQDDYKANQQKVLKIQLEAYKLDMTFTLPGDITSTQILEQKGRDVSLTLDGQKAWQALDQFMADDQALRAAFRAGSDLPANDDIMLTSMYGKKGPIMARVKLAPDAKPLFDYRTEVLVAQLGQTQMLKDAQVETLPRFVVSTSTRPASQPASRPAAQPAAPAR